MDKEQDIDRKLIILDNLDYLERYVNEWLKYNSGSGMTVGERAESKTEQIKDRLIHLKILFDELEKKIENELKTEMLNPAVIGKFIEMYKSKSIFPLEPDKELQEYFRNRMIEIWTKIKIKNELQDTDREIIDYKTFVYLCFELKLIKEKFYGKEQAKEIRQIYERYEHPIFQKIKLKNHIQEKTDIYSLVRKYRAESKESDFNMKIRDLINRLKLNSE